MLKYLDILSPIVYYYIVPAIWLFIVVIWMRDNYKLKERVERFVMQAVLLFVVTIWSQIIAGVIAGCLVLLIAKYLNR